MSLRHAVGSAYHLVRLLPRDFRRPFVPYRQGPRRNIFFFSSRRGGSTFFAQVVEANPEIFTVDQPFEVNGPPTAARRLKRRHLPDLLWGQVVEPSAQQREQLATYLRQLTSGQLMHLGRVKRPGFPYAANRTFLKIVYGSAVIRWLKDTFDPICMYLVRHPAGQALSVMRNQWFLTTEAYLAQPAFVARYLTPEQERFARRIATDGNYWQRAVLNWAMENLAPLREDGSGAHFLTYEELTLNPEATVPWLAQVLELPEPERMAAMVRRPSDSRHLSTAEASRAIASGDRGRLIGGWRKQVDASMAAQGQEILSTLGLEDYRMDSPLPAARRLRFAGSAAR